MRFAYVTFAAVMLACAAPVARPVPSAADSAAGRPSATGSRQATRDDLSGLMTEQERLDLAERAEELMFRYELNKAEYHAASKLKFGRIFLADAKHERQLGRPDEADRLTAKAAKWFNEVIELYGETEAAEDARRLLAGKEVGDRPIPPPPVPPATVRTTDDDAREAVAVEKPGVPSVPWRTAVAAGKTVYVRDYTRSDGTHVRGHYRSPPRR
jgi:hypothetical protein